MIIEARLYAARPMKLGKYLEAFEKVGYPIISRYATLYGYWIAESGPLNRFLHLWRYESLADRASRRAALSREPGWTQDYLGSIEPYLESQRNWILRPAYETEGWARAEGTPRAFAFSFLKSTEVPKAPSKGESWSAQAITGEEPLVVLGRAYSDLAALEVEAKIPFDIYSPAAFSPIR